MAARGLELLRRVPMVLTILKRLSLSLVLVGLATLIYSCRIFTRGDRRAGGYPRT